MVQRSWRTPDGRWLVDRVVGEPGVADRIWYEGEPSGEVAGDDVALHDWLAARHVDGADLIEYGGDGKVRGQPVDVGQVPAAQQVGDGRVGRGDEGRPAEDDDADPAGRAQPRVRGDDDGGTGGREDDGYAGEVHPERTGAVEQRIVGHAGIVAHQAR